jgi:hypothetical protein
MKKSLKSDRTLILTSILLFFMLTAGIISGVLGFISGHTALKGVTQPDIRPNNNKSGSNLGSKNLEMLQERELIANVKKQMGIDEPKKDPKKQAEDAKKQVEAFEKAIKNDPKPEILVAELPIVREDQGIVMAVKSVSTQGNNVKVELTLVNQGSQSVNFGQSTINVTKDSSAEKLGQNAQGISATTVGLPSNLPANGKEVKITISIPKNAVDKVKTISLQLTDIDKKLQLEASGIPVGK